MPKLTFGVRSFGICCKKCIFKVISKIVKEGLNGPGLRIDQSVQSAFVGGR